MIATGTTRRLERRAGLRLAIPCALLLTLAGCGTLFGAKPAPAPKTPPGGGGPPATSPQRERIPRDNQCGPVLDLRKWDVQCASENLAMMCRRSDRTDRRCARKRDGQYRWTYGSFCAHALPCYRRACNGDATRGRK